MNPPTSKLTALLIMLFTVGALVSNTYPHIVVRGTISVGQATAWTTSGNNATITMGADRTFWRIQLNTTMWWFDQSFTDGYYTRYGLYVVSPNDVDLTVNTWFTSTSSTAKLTITAPTSTAISMGFYSPNLLSASVLGATSQTWNAANQTLNFKVNTDTSAAFTLTATANETREDNVIPEVIDGAITDMEGCGNWVFSEEQYYTFQGQYWDGNGYDDLATVKLNFTDGLHTVAVSYSVSASTWTLEAGSDVAIMANGEITVLEQNAIQVTWLIRLKNTILDAYDVDIHLYAIDVRGASSGWIVVADYFNIYNLGGQALLDDNGGSYTGRMVGGDVFDLYSIWGFGDDGDGRWVEASIAFRNLQHIKLLPEFHVLSGADPYPGDSKNNTWFEYFIDYCVEDGDWIAGAWSIKGIIQDWSISGSDIYVLLNLTWYQRGTLVKQQNIYVYGQENVEQWYNQDTLSFRLWVDLWFNRMNSSSYGGGRMNAYYFPMHDSSHPWLVWLVGSNWGIAENQTKESLAFIQLTDDADNVVYAPQIKLVRIRFKLTSDETALATTPGIFAWNHDVFDLTMGDSPLHGIQTPVFDETKVPIMPQGGFLGSVVSWLQNVGKLISDALGPAIMNSWNNFVNFLDMIAMSVLGVPIFSIIQLAVTQLWTMIQAFFNNLLAFLTPLYDLFAATISKFTNVLSAVLNQWILMFNHFTEFLNGTYSSGVAIYTDWNLSAWILVGAILYPIYLLILWDEKGMDAVLNQILFIKDVIMTVLHFMVSLIQLFLNVVGRIIESIPVVE